MKSIDIIRTQCRFGRVHSPNCRPPWLLLQDTIRFDVEGDEHAITVLSVDEGVVKVRIQSEPIELTLRRGESREVDVDGDGVLDVRIEVINIIEDGVIVRLWRLGVQEALAVESDDQARVAPVSEPVQSSRVAEQEVDEPSKVGRAFSALRFLCSSWRPRSSSLCSSSCTRRDCQGASPRRACSRSTGRISLSLIRRLPRCTRRSTSSSVHLDGKSPKPFYTHLSSP